MKRKLAIAAVIALAVLIVISAVAFCFVQAQKAEQERRNQEYALESTRVIPMGEPVSLNSQTDEQGFAFGGYVAGLPWEGAMVVTVTEARVCSSLDEASVDASKALPGPSIDGESTFVVVKMLLRNESAESLGSAKGDDRFNIATFVNLLAGDPPGRTGDVVYFDGTAPDADPRKGTFEFVLGKGQEQAYTVVVEAPTEDLQGGLFMGVGLTHCEKYRISLFPEGSL